MRRCSIVAVMAEPLNSAGPGTYHGRAISWPLRFFFNACRTTQPCICCDVELQRDDVIAYLLYWPPLAPTQVW